MLSPSDSPLNLNKAADFHQPADFHRQIPKSPSEAAAIGSTNNTKIDLSLHQANALLRSAVNLNRSGQTELAKNYLLKALLLSNNQKRSKLSPQAQFFYARAQLELGACEMSERNSKGAEGLFRNAIQAAHLLASRQPRSPQNPFQASDAELSREYRRVLACSYSRLASCSESLNKMAQANFCLSRATRILKGLYGANSKEYEQSEKSRAQFLMRAGCHQRAIGHYRRAVATNTGDKESGIDTLLGLSQCHSVLNQPEVARSYFYKAWTAMRKELKVTQACRALYFFTKAALFNAENLPKQSIKCLIHAAIHEARSHSPSADKIKICLANALDISDQDPNFRKGFFKGITRLIRDNEHCYDVLSPILAEFSHVLFAQQRYLYAGKVAKALMQFAVNTFGENSRQVANAELELARCLMADGKDKGAGKIIQRAYQHHPAGLDFGEFHFRLVELNLQRVVDSARAKYAPLAEKLTRNLIHLDSTNGELSLAQEGNRWRVLLKHYLVLGNTAEALRLSGNLLELNSGMQNEFQEDRVSRAFNFSCLGEVYARNAQYSRARLFHERSLIFASDVKKDAVQHYSTLLTEAGLFYKKEFERLGYVKDGRRAISLLLKAEHFHSKDLKESINQVQCVRLESLEKLLLDFDHLTLAEWIKARLSTLEAIEDDDELEGAGPLV